MTTRADCTNATPPHTTGRILRPHEFFARATYDFTAPADDLRAWVERYWSVQWSLEPGESFQAATLDDPSINLTLERGDLTRDGMSGPGCWLTGWADAGRFPVTLFGAGSVVGVKFRVGGCVGFGVRDPEALHDTTARAEDHFPGIERDWAALPPSAPAAAPLLDAWLTARRPAPDPAYDRFTRLLALLDDPAVTRLDHLAERADCDVRTLQRLFRRFAGQGPKALLARARVIDAVAALDSHTDEPLADLAHRLGWFDQAHFTRDFRRVTGETPAAYRARQA